MTSYNNCRVGDDVIWTTDNYYGFHILDHHNRSLVFFEFATRDEAKQARDEIAKVVAKTVRITSNG
jgi:hypothetical protein